MKRFVCLVLATIMLMCMVLVSASAATFTVPSTNKGSGDVLSGTVEKTTGVGTKSTGSVSSMTTNAKFVFRTRKDTGYNASNTTTVSGANSFSMTTLYDGYGEALLRKGYSYKLAYTHSSSSGVSSGKCNGTWAP